MNCFYHPDKPAIGGCKSCGKGLCRECAATLPGGLACRNACEEKVILLDGIYNMNRKIFVVINAQAHTIGFGIILIAVSVLHLFLYRNDDMFFNDDLVFLPFIGVLLVLYGFFRLAQSRKAFSLANVQIRTFGIGIILIVLGGVPFLCFHNDKFLILSAIGLLFVVDAIFRLAKSPPYYAQDENENIL